MEVMKGYSKDSYNLFCNDGRQQDADEALILIIDIFTKQSEAYNNFISSLFNFYYGKIIKCGVCKVERPQWDVSQGLVIQIPKNANKRSEFEFQTLLSDYFNVPEEMETEVMCNDCGVKPGTVQPTLFAHSEIFIFTLARYKTVCDKKGNLVKVNKIKNFIGLLYSFI